MKIKELIKKYEDELSDDNLEYLIKEMYNLDNTKVKIIIEMQEIIRMTKLFLSIAIKDLKKIENE